MFDSCMHNEIPPDVNSSNFIPEMEYFTNREMNVKINCHFQNAYKCLMNYKNDINKYIMITYS